MKPNIMTLRAFSAMLTDDHEIKYGVAQWLNTGELKYLRTGGEPLSFFRTAPIKNTLQQKWVKVHKDEIIETQWRDVKLDDKSFFEY
jgi:hypothetical protein